MTVTSNLYAYFADCTMKIVILACLVCLLISSSNVINVNAAGCEPGNSFYIYLSIYLRDLGWYFKMVSEVK